MRISDWSSDVCSSDLSKVDAGVLALREEVTAVDEVLDVCERLIRGRAGKGGVRLTLETDRGLRPIVADRIRLKQILVNLLSHAVQFNAPGGDVRLPVFQTEAETVFLVHDNGLGMAPEDVPLALATSPQPAGGIG